MALLRWALIGIAWLVTWAGAILLSGLLGGTNGALGWGLMVYPWLALSAVAYWRAWRAARREEADGTLFLRRCLVCGRAVGEETVICPDQACAGVEFGYQWDVYQRDEVFRTREAAMLAEDLNRQSERRAEQLRPLSNWTIMPMWVMAAWYWRGMMRQAPDAPDTDRLRWWSSRMLAFGGVFAALVVNATAGHAEPSTGSALDGLLAWGRMLSVLGGALLLSAWIAVSGPGSARARLRMAERMKADASPHRA